MYISFIKFHLGIYGRKGFTKISFSIYFGGSNHFVCISRTVYHSLDPVVGIGYSILCIF